MKIRSVHYCLLYQPCCVSSIHPLVIVSSLLQAPVLRGADWRERVEEQDEQDTPSHLHLQRLSCWSTSK